MQGTSGLRWLSIGASFVLLTTTARAQVPEATSVELCRPGVWDVTSKMFPGGIERAVRATSTVTCLFDGRVEMAEYRSFGPGGAVGFRGISFHVWDAEAERRQTLWVMIGDPGYTLLDERMEDGALWSEGQGFDGAGSFLETSRTTFDDDEGYRFEMDRSYDGGATWTRPFNVIEATKSDREPPAPPAALVPLVEQARASVGAAGGGLVVLDGVAAVATTTEADAGETRRTIRFSSRYPQPDRWRTIVWEIGSGEVRVVEQPIETAR